MARTLSSFESSTGVRRQRSLQDASWPISPVTLPRDGGQLHRVKVSPDWNSFRSQRATLGTSRSSVSRRGDSATDIVAPPSSPGFDRRSQSSVPQELVECRLDTIDSRLESLALSFESSKRKYRHQLSTKLACAFCVFVVVAVVAFVASLAFLVRHESLRGVLVGLEGTFLMAPLVEADHCARGSARELATYRSVTVAAVEGRLDAVFGDLATGNGSTSTSYSGSLVERLSCVLRPGRQDNSVNVKVEFVVFWRRRRGQFGTLSKVPAPDLLVKALATSLRGTNGTLASLRVALDSVTIHNYERIL